MNGFEKNPHGTKEGSVGGGMIEDDGFRKASPKKRKALIPLNAPLCSKIAKYAPTCILSQRRLGSTSKDKES